MIGQPNRNEGLRIFVRVLQVQNEIDTSGIDTSTYVPVRLAHCRDKHGGLIQATWRDTEAIHQIPAPGDVWSACNYSYHWVLERRIDSDQEAIDKASLSPGDTHIRAPGPLVINHGNLGYTTYEEIVVDGIQTTVTLAVPPVHANTVQVYKATGSIILPSAFTVSDNIVTFSPAPAAQTLTIYYQRT